MSSDGLNTLQIECAVARYFHPRRNLVVPNVSWGMGLHECDLLVATAAGYLWEVEIKTTIADLKRDALKWHQHRSDRVKFLYFAIPRKLEVALEFVPERAGVIVVDMPSGRWADGTMPRARQLRPAIANATARPLTESERYDFARLGALRIWGLKAKLAAHRTPQ